MGEPIDWGVRITNPIDDRLKKYCNLLDKLGFPVAYTVYYSQPEDILHFGCEIIFKRGITAPDLYNLLKLPGCFVQTPYYFSSIDESWTISSIPTETGAMTTLALPHREDHLKILEWIYRRFNKKK